jgi:phosphopantothenoylcysteine synthetase/decarboxylase
VPSFGSATGDVLYLVICAAPPARDAPALIDRLVGAGWDVNVVATPTAVAWIDPVALETLTGHPVRTQFRAPDDPEYEPRGDAVLVVPATFNTLNKLAAGINDTLALGLLNEALGRAVPVVVVPWMNDALASHPAYGTGMARLVAAGVEVIEVDTSDRLVGLAVDVVNKHLG